MNRVSLIFISVIPLALAQCSSPSSDGAHSDWTFDIVISEAIEMAAEIEDVAPSQRELLEEARSHGEVTLAMMYQATRDMDQCLQESGLQTAGIESQRWSGVEFPVVMGIMSPSDMNDDQVAEVLDYCDRAHVIAVSFAYSQQPQSSELYWIEAREHEPRIRECLTDAGVPESELGDSIQDLINAAVQIMHPESPYGFQDCLHPLDLPLRSR